MIKALYEAEGGTSVLLRVYAVLLVAIGAVLVYGGGDGRVEPFTLTVHGSRASLAVAGRRIQAPFSWFM